MSILAASLATASFAEKQNQDKALQFLIQQQTSGYSHGKAQWLWQPAKRSMAKQC
jgi:hypothetical protein